MSTEVLAPFDGFLQSDPRLNGVKIPGLLYADDLVLLCLTGDLLRARLRRLAAYAQRNMLTVNVAKCEVVVFGGRTVGHGSFRYNGQLIPIRSSCKYLGVWLDADRSGRSLRNAILEKFQAGVPVFFNLCRRLRIGDLPHIYQLAQALLFSLLYGAEFMVSADVLRRCETAWWRGVRQFYGLPNGVSSATLRLLFPRFNLVHKVLLGKVGLSLRGLQSRDTLLPEALIFDRGFLFRERGLGFVQTIADWGRELELPAIHLETSREIVAGQLREAREREMNGCWETFSRMSSTKDAAIFLGSRFGFRQASVEASNCSRLGLRVFLLAITGSLSQSYLSTRTCPFCVTKFDFLHFISCPSLGDNLEAALAAAGANEDWKEFSRIILSRFRVFLHLFRHGQCDVFEDELFDFLDEEVCS
jgi:hypothetical protein